MKILHKTSFRNISHTFPVCAIFLILRTRCTKKLAMSENQQQQQNIKGHVDDTKPEGPSEHVNLKVTGQDGSVVHFKIKKNTALRKLMSAYCERTGTKMGSLRFMFDGQVIGEGDSPSLLDMEDGDTIDVFQQQTGGMCRK